MLRLKDASLGLGLLETEKYLYRLLSVPFHSVGKTSFVAKVNEQKMRWMGQVIFFCKKLVKLFHHPINKLSCILTHNMSFGMEE